MKVPLFTVPTRESLNLRDKNWCFSTSWSPFSWLLEKPTGNPLLEWDPKAPSLKLQRGQRGVQPQGCQVVAAAGLSQGFFLPHVSLYEVPVFTNMDIHAYTYIPA